MPAGRYRHRVTLQNATITRDEYGGVIQIWHDLDTVWAAVDTLKGDEYFAAHTPSSTPSAASPSATAPTSPPITASCSRDAPSTLKPSSPTPEKPNSSSCAPSSCRAPAAQGAETGRGHRSASRLGYPTLEDYVDPP